VIDSPVRGWILASGFSGAAWVSKSPTLTFAIAPWRCQRLCCGIMTKRCMRITVERLEPEMDSSGRRSTKDSSFLRAMSMTPCSGGAAFTGARLGT